MAKKISETPLYLLDAFSRKAKDNAVYIETLATHLKTHNFLSRPHKHDFYLLLYITRGGGQHIIDFRRYNISPGSFFLMTPGQVHYWNLNSGTDGFIIFFLPSFYTMGSTDKSLMEFPFFHSFNADPHIVLTGSQKRVIDFAIAEMYAEFTSAGKLNLRMLRSYLEIVLLKLSTDYPAIGEKNCVDGVSFKIRKLEQLIEKHYLKKKQPREYADLMNLSPSYLNALCKEALGKTLTDLISARVILEAKRLFSYSDLNVSEVANRLNFTDSSYFIRFFRKHTDLTPAQFKETLKSTV